MAKTNKVNPNGKKEKKEKVRVDFDLKSAMCKDKDGKVVSAVNTDNLLIAVPVPIKDESGKVVYAGFNHRKHNPLKKGDFASMATFIRFQAYVNKLRAAVLLKSAEEKEAKAARIEQFGDEATRKKVQKLARMQEAMAALQEQLKEDGVDLSKLG